MEDLDALVWQDEKGWWFRLPGSARVFGPRKSRTAAIRAQEERRLDEVARQAMEEEEG